MRINNVVKELFALLRYWYCGTVLWYSDSGDVSSWVVVTQDVGFAWLGQGGRRHLLQSGHLAVVGVDVLSVLAVFLLTIPRLSSHSTGCSGGFVSTSFTVSGRPTFLGSLGELFSESRESSVQMLVLAVLQSCFVIPMFPPPPLPCPGSLPTLLFSETVSPSPCIGGFQIRCLRGKTMS